MGNAAFLRSTASSDIAANILRRVQESIGHAIWLSAIRYDAENLIDLRSTILCLSGRCVAKLKLFLGYAKPMRHLISSIGSTLRLRPFQDTIFPLCHFS